MTTNLDQSRSQEYVSDTIAYMQKTCSAPGKKSKADSWDFASATLFQVLLSALSAKEETLDELNLISRSDLKGVENSFKDSLVVQMRSLLKKPEKLDSSSRTARHLELLSIIDVLTALGVDGLKLTELIDHAKTFINSLTETDGEVASRLETFISGHARNEDGELVDTELKGDALTTYGRQGIIDKANALVTGKSEKEKLELVQAIFGEDLAGISMLDKLLAARHVISTCKGLLVLTKRKLQANDLQMLDDHLWKMKMTKLSTCQRHILCFVANYGKPIAFYNFLLFSRRWR